MRIACLSDVHGNYLSLQKALSFIDAQTVDKIIFLGDAIGYFPSLKVLDILRERGDIVCICGNHDDVVLSKSISEKSENVYHHQMVLDQITPAYESQVQEWHDYYSDHNAVFFHGGPSDHQNQYIYPDTDLFKIYQPIKGMSGAIKICVSGHTHRPFVKMYEDMMFVNAGSVGLPRDFGTYGAFAIIDTHNITADIYRFDVEGDLKQMIEFYPQTHSSVIELMSRNKDQTPQGIILS